MRRAHLARAHTLLLAALACGCSSGDDESTYSREKLMDPETCKECHQDHFREWSGSMHAYAATDPVFLAMNSRGQRETKGQLGDFCVSCHAPLAVQEGATEDGLNLDTVPKALQGITCYFCHQVTDVQGTHNNPLVLANDTAMRGGIGDPLKYNAHQSKYSKLHDSDLLESASLCGPCHDIVVPKHFSGATAGDHVDEDGVHLERTFEEWKGSVFADERSQPLSCGGCHMTPDHQGEPIANPPGSHEPMPTNRSRHSHLFPGVDTALLDFPEKEAQRQAVQDFLDLSLRIEICVPLISGDIVVTVENLSAGHNVPTGASQDRRMWVELHVFDGAQDVYQSGSTPEGTPVVSLTPEPRLLRDLATAADGSPAHMFWNVASIESGTLPVQTRAPGSTHALSFPYAADFFAKTGRLQPTRVQVIVNLEPIGLDVLDDLIGSGDLNASVRDAMPRFDVRPARDREPGTRTALDWTFEAADTRGYTLGDSNCQESTTLPP